MPRLEVGRLFGPAWGPLCSVAVFGEGTLERATSAAWRPPSARRRVQQPRFGDSAVIVPGYKGQ